MNRFPRNLLSLTACMAGLGLSTVQVDGAVPDIQKPVIDTTRSPFIKLRGIPLRDTRLTGGFFATRFELAATKMVPAIEKFMLGDGSANLNRIK